MTPIKPHLFLKRLIVVTINGKVAYDEEFHTGVNIIRGKNTIGKSTITNFIFYVLGGDYSNWTNAATKCQEVFAEIDINGAIITLKRIISENALQPMFIYWGPYNEAQNNVVGWELYPYRQTDNQVSFSRVIFNTLSFPEIKSENDSTITLHQILRLLYIDQDTSTQNLFRADRFDPPLTRQTVAELLLGIYDDDLYTDRQKLKSGQSLLNTKKLEYDGIKKYYSDGGNELNIESISKEIDSLQNQFNEVEHDITVIKQKVNVRVTSRTPLKSENLQNELTTLKTKIRAIKEEIDDLSYDISDSKLFVETLLKRIKELDHSLITRKIFSELPLTHCPQCLRPLNTSTSEGICNLCKQTFDEDHERSHAKRLRQEMDLQTKESESLLQVKIERLSALNLELSNYSLSARNLQIDLNATIKDSQSTRDEKLDDLYTNKGKIEQKIAFLTNELKAVDRLEKLKSQLVEIDTGIKKLKISIESRESTQRNNYFKAMEAIKNFTIYLLQRDQAGQEEFSKGSEVQIDFYKDLYSLDGRNNFSASSKVILKNSVLYSIFFASLELGYFRYPKFILCDNMEDSGMVEERSHNFQNQIVALSRSIKEEHQIIFTTSMISDELNNDPSVCIGEFYTPENKTLKIE